MGSPASGESATALVRARTKAGAIVNRAYPRLPWALWSARRTARQLRPAELKPALVNQVQRRRPPAIEPGAPTKLLLVVPTADHVEIPWEPALGNYSFELFETAQACIGTSHVETLRVEPGGSASAWQSRVVDHLRDGDFTHVLSRIDIEPNGSRDWEWDRFVRTIRRDWNGVFLTLVYDSAYPYLSMHLDRLTRLHSRVMPVVLDRPITPAILPTKPAAGPLFLPLSDRSMGALHRAVDDAPRDLDLTFIGNVRGYPYRSELLDQLQAAGLVITVNPQRDDSGTLPGFAAYARALARSKITINFSRCNGVPVTQLKTRLLEGSLFGAIVASDSPLYARDYFAEGQEFIAYSSPEQLRGQVESLIGDDARLEQMRGQAIARAEVLRVRNFWEQVSLGLDARKLAPLPLAR